MSSAAFLFGALRVNIQIYKEQLYNKHRLDFFCFYSGNDKNNNAILDHVIYNDAVISSVQIALQNIIARIKLQSHNN